MLPRALRLLLPSLLLPFFLFSFLPASPALASERTFTEFALDLPEGWDGSDRAGFISKDRNEYMLVVGKKDEANEQYLAHISLFLLPNKPGKNAHDSAQVLAEQQADASELRERGLFWTFTGNPRDNVLKGMATTYVAASPETLCIIIVKDPSQINAVDILESLRPVSDRAKALFGDKTFQK